MAGMMGCGMAGQGWYVWSWVNAVLATILLVALIALILALTRKVWLETREK